MNRIEASDIGHPFSHDVRLAIVWLRLEAVGNALFYSGMFSTFLLNVALPFAEGLFFWGLIPVVAIGFGLQGFARLAGTRIRKRPDVAAWQKSAAETRRFRLRIVLGIAAAAICLAATAGSAWLNQAPQNIALLAFVATVPGQWLATLFECLVPRRA